MKTRKIGTLEVSALGLGCMGMSEFYGKANREDGIRAIKEAFRLGINFFDTADSYGYGDNEKLIAEALKDVPREQVIIATKCGIVRDRLDPTKRSVNTTPDYIKQCCSESLKRLNTDYIDLFYLHRLDGVTPIEDSMGALVELVKEGKIRHIGLSEVDAAIIRRAYAVYPVTAIQSEYSLWSRGQEQAVIPVCRELNIGLVAYSPLGRGFLTGQIKSASMFGADDFRHYAPRFNDSNIKSNLELITYMEATAKLKGCTLSQLALAWVLAQGGDIVPIPGTTKIQHLKDNVGALNVNLTSQEIEKLNQMIESVPVSGERYPEQTMKAFNLIA